MTIRKTKPAAFSCHDWLPFPPLRASQQVSALMKIDIKIRSVRKITKMENIIKYGEKEKLKGNSDSEKEKKEKQ